MPTITRAGSSGRVGTARSRARKTVAFDGTTGNGEVGTVDLFTVTGAVYIDRITARCTETCVGVGTMACGGASDTDGLMTSITPSNFAAGEFWASGNVVAGQINMPRPTVGGANAGIPLDKAFSEDVILTIASNDVTNGTVIFDVWFTPISDDGNVEAA